MTDQDTSASQEASRQISNDPPIDNTTSIGEILRNAREAASYSIPYVAAHTHLKEEVIIALENDDHDQLPSAVFIKGYIRSYAKLLEVDVEPLLGDYTQSSEVEYVTPQVKKPKKVRSSGADPVVIWSSVTVGALLLGLVLTWWLHSDDADPVELADVVEQLDSVEPTQQQASTESASSSNTNNKQDELHQVGLGTVDPKNISEIQNASPESIDPQLSSEQSQDIASLADTDSYVESPVSGGDIDKVRITVRYTQESWTEIFDARKRRLLHGLIKPGATRVISGQAPFNVFLGNSPGVELEINGKPFDHSVYMRRNNTARFLIDDINS